MDTLTFIAEIVGHIAWPVTAIIIFMILRKPLLRLLPAIQRLRFHDVVLDFNQQVQSLAVEARRQLPPLHGAMSNGENLRAKWIELAQSSPRAVVLEAWLRLEEAAIEAARRHGLNLKSVEQRAPLILGQALEEAAILDGETPGIYHQLRNLRNAAAHASDFAFTPESAIEYADLAARLTEYLQNRSP